MGNWLSKTRIAIYTPSIWLTRLDEFLNPLSFVRPVWESTRGPLSPTLRNGQRCIYNARAVPNEGLIFATILGGEAVGGEREGGREETHMYQEFIFPYSRDFPASRGLNLSCQICNADGLSTVTWLVEESGGGDTGTTLP